MLNVAIVAFSSTQQQQQQSIHFRYFLRIIQF